MNGDMNGDMTGGITDRAEPMERVRRGLEAAGDCGWESPSAPGITVERLLGVGSGALVWLVWWDSPAEPDWHLVDGCPPAAFALKVPRHRSVASPSLASAGQELQALDMLRHEHLVRAYGVLETSRGLGLMLEPYSAGSLAGLLRGVGTLSLGEAVTVLTPIATALGALHRGGVTHGDVSPGNILLAADGKPALGDLADAQVLGRADPGTGTLGFAAPERELESRLPLGADSAMRREARAGLTPEADVYALAAVTWFALTGTAPAQTSRRTPLLSLRPELSEAIALLLESALQSDPALRPSAEDFAVELFRCAAPTPLDLAPHVHEEVVPELPTMDRTDHHRRRWVLGVGAAVLTTLGFGGLWFSAADSPLIPSADVPSAGVSDRADDEARQLMRQDDPVRALQGLAALRTEALEEVSQEKMRGYTAAGSPARTAEAALIRELAEHGSTYQGDPLEIRVSEELESSGPRRPGQQVAELRARVTASALDTGAAESQEVVLVLHREAGKWLLHEVRDADDAP